MKNVYVKMTIAFVLGGIAGATIYHFMGKKK
jgi:hypothetical protein